MSQRRGWRGWARRISRHHAAAASAAAARSHIWAAAVARMAAAARLSISAAAAARRMAAAARPMAGAVQAVARDIVDSAAVLPQERSQDAAAARIAGNRIHQMRLPFVIGCGATKPPQSNRCRRKIMP
jgi:hypothetical protein